VNTDGDLRGSSRLAQFEADTDSTMLPVLTVLICTYNRRDDVLELLDSIQSQNSQDRFLIESLVVDNNSSDGTREAVENRFRLADHRIRCISEYAQGKCNALNTGLRVAAGDIISVIDSDQVLPPDYLLTVFETFQKHSELAILGGKVLPRWASPPPAWLTPEHWSAIAMADFGDQFFFVDPNNPICLLATSFRASAIKQTDGYRTGLSVSAGKIGGVEDAEMIDRLMNLGFKAAYNPQLRLEHKVEPVRLTQGYHRRWHAGHGAFFALLRDAHFEQSHFTVLGIPGHVFRETLNRLRLYVYAKLRHDDMALAHELRLRFLFGFIRQRLTQTTPSQL
jgi:glucosyl-dolichyl phosphate glucuronosyltransferase